MRSAIGRFPSRAVDGDAPSWRTALAATMVMALASCTAVVPDGGTGGSAQRAQPSGGGASGGGINGSGNGGRGTGGNLVGTGGSGGVGSSADAGAGAGGRVLGQGGSAGSAGSAGSGAGGAVVDAGRDVGAGGGDGGGVVSALCPPSALVCEDFEDGRADGWSALATGMAMSTAHASSGTTSLGITIPANARGGMITFKGAPLFPLVNKTMWGRVMVWFDSISDGHTDIIRGQAASGGNPLYNVAEQHGAYMLNYYNGSAATDCWARPVPPTPTVVPLGKWMCWEWRFDAANNDMQFFVDGALYRRVTMTGDGCLTGNGVWVAPPDFGMVGIGATIAELRPTVMQMWFDDIAIGTQARIGCPAP